MKTNFKIYLLVLSIGLFSCQDELEFNNIENSQPVAIAEKTLENGRFLFTSRESLKTTIENFQNDEIENVEKEFEKLYEKGFRSHKPIVNPENEQLQAKFSKEIMLKRQMRKSSSNSFSKTTSTENEENEEEFIADPLLASLVNENNEIIVNDTLYKFTKEKGLFFTHIKDSTYLFNFFKEDTEQSNKTISKSAATYRVAPCEMRAEYGGVTRVDDRVSRYLSPIEDDCYGGGGSGGGGSGGGNPPSSSQTTEEERIQQIINSLPECDGNAGGNWFQNIFGKSYVCRNYFGSKHRIKTEFWDQSWLFYKSVGVLTKTQRKRFWIWWASKSDEIHLGINRILLKYNYKQPVITAINFAVPYKFPLYMYKGTIQTKQYSNGNYYVNTAINVPEAKIPFFDFGNNSILNIYIPNAPILGNTNINLTTQDITTQSNIKALYKLGIDFLKTKYGTGKIPKEFAVTYQKNTNEIEVLYFGERISATNENKIKKKFYSDVSFVISAAWGDSTEKWKFNIKPAESAFRNYTHYELDFYGMARRGSTWKGNRMIR
jgi:hypothetical protein